MLILYILVCTKLIEIVVERIELNTIQNIYLFLFRDLTGNHLNESVPSGLLKKIQDGFLKLRLILHYLASIWFCQHQLFRLWAITISASWF